MEIERLTSKIIKEAEEESKKIKKEYEERAEELKAEMEKEREALRKAERERIKKKIEKMRKKALGDKKIEVRNQLLSYQLAMIRDIFQEVKKDFRARVGDYPKIIREIIGKFAQPGDTLIFSPEDFSIFQNEFPELKKENSQELTAGVIIKKEREEIDFSLETTLAAIKEEIFLAFRKYLLV
ncbi:MAG: V-type ATP synthase subunit E family protein [candidate division WOR-3 bacterium]